MTDPAEVVAVAPAYLIEKTMSDPTFCWLLVRLDASHRRQGHGPHPVHRGPVGEVVTVGGSKNLNGGGTRLSTGAKLTLGEHLVMGKDLKATLQLVKPKGVGDRELVDLSPAKGAKARCQPFP